MNKLKKLAIRLAFDNSFICGYLFYTIENLAPSDCNLPISVLILYRSLLRMIDTDNSGHITYEELKAGLERVGANLKESEISGLMQAADIDNSGTIDYGEFLAATLHLNKIEREDHLFAAFSYFDKDGSGYITQDKLQWACEEFGLEEVHLEELIREVDQDNDGRIDYSEFVTMMLGSGFNKKGLQNNLSIGFREALKLG
ncbi:hypothetical protein HHK36_011519 [Tetracentron sinense]|uniref:EF-hand domain-containing protein n=1 Tax=Tetracentron sinense TaxID=13715 RepID=A0A834ZGH1_TETSI|nr:hypothetical protein HHK36_011519 [Tetracentron sinense]